MKCAEWRLDGSTTRDQPRRAEGLRRPEERDRRVLRGLRHGEPTHGPRCHFDRKWQQWPQDSHLKP